MHANGCCNIFVFDLQECTYSAITTLEYSFNTIILISSNYKLSEWVFITLLLLHIFTSDISIINSMLLHNTHTPFPIGGNFPISITVMLRYRSYPTEGFILFKQFCFHSFFVLVRFHRIKISECLTFVNMEFIEKNTTTTTLSTINEEKTECFEWYNIICT